MTTIKKTNISPVLLPLEDWQITVQERLDKAFHLSPRLPFDDRSKIVLFSDCHRGTNNRYDAFAPNAALFLHTLTHYYEQGFTYIELGDGDELWRNRRFQDIRQAYHSLFDLLHQFNKSDRLHLILGNHEAKKTLFDSIEKEGIPLQHGLILEHVTNEQTLFAVHGHQAIPQGDHLWWFKRRQSRYFWKYLISLGFYTWYYVAEPQPGLPHRHQLERIPIWLSEWILNKAREVEMALKLWAQSKRQPTICGHTHMCAFPEPDEIHYFNTGQCVSPGYITGLEIDRGIISLVKWKYHGQQIKRYLLKERPLAEFCHD